MNSHNVPKLCSLVMGTAFGATGCLPVTTSTHQNEIRDDGAVRVEVNVSGSLQNPAWSPDGTSILFTRFRASYNQEPADLFILELTEDTPRPLVTDGSGNVNLPGSAWNAVTHEIVFSSSREPHDEIFVIDEDGLPGDETRITGRDTEVAYEPSFSPDGGWVVVESHTLDVEDNGVIVKFKLDGTQPYQNLTDPLQDSRQPNWSPTGNLIVYQTRQQGQWDLRLTDPQGAQHQALTAGPGDKTDASFSPDGRWVVYSSTEHGEDTANLFIVPVAGGDSVRLTYFAGYDGAPSWSPDGRQIAFESYVGDGDDGMSTSIWTIAAPADAQP